MSNWDSNMPNMDHNLWESAVDGETEAENDGGRRRQIALFCGGILLGLLVGWFVLGWLVWPVKWVDATVAQMSTYDKANVVTVASRLYAFDGNSSYPLRLFDTWEPDERDRFICAMAEMSGDAAEESRLLALLRALNGRCDHG